MSFMGYWGYDEPEWDSENDSTWEDDEDYELLKQTKVKKDYPQRSWSKAAMDLKRYRHGYPDQMLNLKFYRNEIPFEPYGVFIDDILNFWKDNYYQLEQNHSFIQWLFPLQEPGMNSCATPLTKKEIEEMKKDEMVKKRFLESYRLMLGFYGIELVDSETGILTRAKNWRGRFSNLNVNTHNNLRITRILKCLGELGYEHFQIPLVEFFLEETLCNGNLPNVQHSALDYFLFTVKNKSERKRLVLFAWENYQSKEKFKWGPVEILKKLRPPAASPVAYSNKDIKQENIGANKNGMSNDDNKMQCEVTGREQENKIDRNSSWLRKYFHFIYYLILGFYSFFIGHRQIGRPPMNFRPGENKEIGRPTTDFGLGDNKENEESQRKSLLWPGSGKGQERDSFVSPVGSKSEDDHSKRVPLMESGQRHNAEKGGADGTEMGSLPMQSALEDNKDSESSQTESGLDGNKQNEGYLREDGSKSSNKNVLESNEKDGLVIRNGGPLAESGSVEVKSNDQPVTQSGLEPDKNSARSPEQSPTSKETIGSSVE